MPEPNKIELALEAMGYCDDLKVKIANGKIVAICKGRYFVPEKDGVKKEIVIDKPITR